MPLRITLIFFSILGIVSTFLPWLHYPKPNATVYGYLSDGIVTGFIFFLFLLYFIYSFKKPILNYTISFLAGILSLWMSFEAYYKISEIEAEKLSFSTDNPIIALSSAGFHQGIGIYVMGIAGIGVFLLLAVAIILQLLGVNSNISKINSNNRRNAFLSVILVICIIAAFVLSYGVKMNKPDDESIKRAISQSVSEMGKAIVNKNFEKFVSYNHPIMIQSYGGKQRTIDLLNATLSELNRSGYHLQSVSLDEVIDIKIKNNNIQAIINQEMNLDSVGVNKFEKQKMIAISEDNGANWSFININGKSKSEIAKSFPILNQNLNF